MIVIKYFRANLLSYCQPKVVEILDQEYIRWLDDVCYYLKMMRSLKDRRRRLFVFCILYFVKINVNDQLITYLAYVSQSNVPPTRFGNFFPNKLLCKYTV